MATIYHGHPYPGTTAPPSPLPDPDVFAPLDVLVIAPHPDDAELTMGGTLTRMADAGLRTGVLDLTTGEPTPLGSPSIRFAEMIAATQPLGLTWRGNAGLINRSLVNDLASRDRIAGYVRCLRPRWLFAPYWHDAHPDHVAASALADAVRFHAKLSNIDLPGVRHHASRMFYYHCYHLRQAITPAFIVDISEQWERKERSLRAYETQLVQGRGEAYPTFIDRFREDNAHWGFLIDTTYGEPFSCKEPIGLSGFGDLI